MTEDELAGAELATTAMMVTISSFVAKNPTVPVTAEVIQEAIGIVMLHRQTGKDGGRFQQPDITHVIHA
jgi:hypothetical protein